MINLKQLTLIGTLLLGALQAQAQWAPPKIDCLATQIEVVYVNGVGNDLTEAMAGLASIQKLIGSKPRQGLPLKFMLVHNETAGIKNDVFETLRLKAVAKGLTEVQISSALLDSSFLLAATKQHGPSSLTVAGILDLVGALTAWKVEDLKLRRHEPDLLLALQSIRDLHGERNPLVLVGHSEGTVFLDFLRDDLISKGQKPNSILSYGIGAAADSIGSNSANILNKPNMRNWVTRVDDQVINALRAKVGALPPTNSNSDGSIIGHLLASNYIDSSLGSNIIAPAVEKLLVNVEIPAPSAKCAARLTMNFAQPIPTPWDASTATTMGLLGTMDATQFRINGTPGNSCQSGERGNFSNVAYPTLKTFLVPYDAPQNVPGGSYFNRRPCSSFVAYWPETKNGEVRYRVRANFSSRYERLFPFPEDYEYHMRYDSGDPFSNARDGWVCEAGRTYRDGQYIRTHQASGCKFALTDAP